MPELLDQRLDRREVRYREAYLVGRDVLPLDRLPEDGPVLAARAYCGEDPEPRYGEAGPAQLLPVQVQAPRLDQEEHEQRADALREAVHRDVDERLGLLLEIVW